MTASSPSGRLGADLGKLMRLPGRPDPAVWDFEDIGDWWDARRRSKIAPIIAVPTTPERIGVGRAGVITHERATPKVISIRRCCRRSSSPTPN